MRLRVQRSFAAGGYDDVCQDGTELYQRADDKEEVIGKRLEVYEQQTRPLVEHYSKLGLLRAIAGEGELDDVFERMEAAALAKPVSPAKVKVQSATVARRCETRRPKPQRRSRAKTQAGEANERRRRDARVEDVADARLPRSRRSTKAKVAPRRRSARKRRSTAQTKSAKRKSRAREEATSLQSTIGECDETLADHLAPPAFSDALGTARKYELLDIASRRE